MKRVVILFAVLGCFLMHLYGEGDAASVEMVFVKGGTFQMGSNELAGKTNIMMNGPAHKVMLSSFWIGKYEVTQKEWSDVMGTNPSRFHGDNIPVEQVSWYDAVEFCNKLSKMDGFEPVYIIRGNNVTCDFSKNGYRLPTEAEWEFAARGGNKSRGYTYAGSNDYTLVTWLTFDRDSDITTKEVGTKQPNELGIFDMSGNVSEWCWDWFEQSYYKQSPVNNPQGPSNSTINFRAIRGGNIIAQEKSSLSSYSRGAFPPDNKVPAFGFRLVRTAGK